MRKTLIAGTAVGFIASVGLAMPAAASTTDDPAQLAVLHAVPDTPVDVYVNDELTLDDFQPGDLGGPLELPAGSYSVAITAADAEDASSPVIGPVDLSLESGGNYTAVAHLDEGGDPTATLFENDTSETAAGEGRLTVRHVAAAPAVDILADGSPVIEGLENPNQESLDLAAGTVPASVALAGETDPVIGPADVEVMEGVNTIVYATGGGDADLSLAVQTVNTESAPDGVDSGQAGLAAEADAAPLAWGAAGLAGLLAFGLIAFTRTRAASTRR